MAAGPQTPSGSDDSLPALSGPVPRCESVTVPPPRTESDNTVFHKQLSAELLLQRPCIRAEIRKAKLSQHMDEIEQDTYVRIYVARMKGLVYKADENGEAFARHAARLAIKDFLRRKGRASRFVPVPEIKEPTGNPPADDASRGSARLHEFLRKCVPDSEEREIYLLSQLEKYKIKEIAAKLGRDRRTVANRLKAAKSKVEQAVKDDGAL